MRRVAFLSLLAGVILAGVGCKQVCGRGDCSAHPGDATPAPYASPYHTMPATGAATSAPAAATPAPMPLPGK